MGNPRNVALARLVLVVACTLRYDTLFGYARHGRSRPTARRSQRLRGTPTRTVTSLISTARTSTVGVPSAQGQRTALTPVPTQPPSHRQRSTRQSPQNSANLSCSAAFVGSRHGQCCPRLQRRPLHMHLHALFTAVRARALCLGGSADEVLEVLGTTLSPSTRVAAAPASFCSLHLECRLLSDLLLDSSLLRTSWSPFCCSN